MAYRRTAISSFLRAVLAASWFHLPSRGSVFPCCLLCNRPATPSLRLRIPSGSLIRCQSVHIYHHHPVFPISGAKLPKMVGAPTSLAPTLCAVSFFPFQRGLTLPQCPVTHFCILTRNLTVCFTISCMRVCPHASYNVSVLLRCSSCLLLCPLMSLPVVT
jgi:hypothetical protein